MRIDKLLAAAAPLTLGMLGAAGAASPEPPAIGVQFGAPTHVQRLLYRKMYDKKPFADAVLLYYDNGLYKIVSPGEEHYGVYVVQGDVKAASYVVHYISLPSADWSGRSAYHTLRFDNASGSFTQDAVVPVDGRLEQQYGAFSTAASDAVDPRAVDWPRAQRMIAAPAGG